MFAIVVMPQAFKEFVAGILMDPLVSYESMEIIVDALSGYPVYVPQILQDPLLEMAGDA